MPKISVIIPSYNSKKLLQRAIDSVLNQSFIDFELLVIDDGSTDWSFELCKEIEKADNRLKVYKKENGGVFTARNFGLDKAEGEYIAFLDADDYYSLDALEKMMTAIVDAGADSACCGFVECFDDGQTGKIEKAPLCNGIHIQPEIQKSISSPMLDDRIREGFLNGMIWRYIFNKEIINNNNIRFSEKYLEDELFLIEYCSLCEKMVSVDEPLYNYYFNTQSVTRTYCKDLTITFMRVLEKKEELKNKYNIPVNADWKDNSAWAMLIAEIGNEFGRGRKISVGEHIANLKRLANVPEYKHAVATLSPDCMEKRKALVANMFAKRQYLLLTLLYIIKNRNSK